MSLRPEVFSDFQPCQPDGVPNQNKWNLINLILEGLFIPRAPYVALSSHFSWQAQPDVQLSPTLYDDISEIPFTFCFA